jgi:hypothetical protein
LSNEKPNLLDPSYFELAFETGKQPPKAPQSLAQSSNLKSLYLDLKSGAQRFCKTKHALIITTRCKREKIKSADTHDCPPPQQARADKTSQGHYLKLKRLKFQIK